MSDRAQRFETCHIAAHTCLRVTHEKLAIARRASKRWKALAMRVINGRRFVERVSIRLAEQVSAICGAQTSNVSGAIDVVRACASERDELRALLSKPQTRDFVSAVAHEAAHQRARWGSEHDTQKTAADWYWLTGYLAGKALTASLAGDLEKARHHTISTAAALSHWHASLCDDATTKGSEAIHG